MKKRFKNFCAGFLMTLLVPAMVGGQLISSAAQRHLQDKAIQKVRLAEKQQTFEKEQHIMDKALCILP